MNEIDFLPDGFVSRRQRMHRLVRLSALLVLVFVAMGGWYFNEHRSLGHLQQFLTAAEAQQVVLTKTKDQIALLQQRAGQLRKTWRLQRHLTPVISSTAILATRTELMPQSITLTNLTLEQLRAPVHPINKQTTHDHPRTFITIQLEDLTPSGVDLANLIVAVEEHPMFEHIEIKDSQSTRAHGLIAQVFRLTLRVPLDRQYLPAQQQPQSSATLIQQGQEVLNEP